MTAGLEPGIAPSISCLPRGYLTKSRGRATEAPRTGANQSRTPLKRISVKYVLKLLLRVAWPRN